ncbi:LuxR C-terminal-related transcriptional regulator [Nocardia sp. NPDC127606]|uniref:LuxR C-terminal-related transcriptional regulator n=1 Tax=Nocardia sp. NPDC127606 TaxID=3345406 RepID=UPI003643861B
MTGLGESRGVRIGVVEDHELLIEGLRQALVAAPDLDVAAAGGSVDALLALNVPVDMAILDLSLDDDSTPRGNVEQLHRAGIEKVLVLTTGDRPDLVREAARAGVLGVIRKSESAEAICVAVRSAAAGEPIGTIDWATAIDADPSRPRLAPREEEALALYAAGESAADVAELMGVSKNTVNLYLTRIRAKYAAAGSPVVSRSQLRRTAQRDGIVPRPWWRARK